MESGNRRLDVFDPRTASLVPELTSAKSDPTPESGQGALDSDSSLQRCLYGGCALKGETVRAGAQPEDRYETNAEQHEADDHDAEKRAQELSSKSAALEVGGNRRRSVATIVGRFGH